VLFTFLINEINFKFSLYTRTIYIYNHVCKPLVVPHASVYWTVR